MDAEKIIEKFDLQKHPEGGYFKEVYRSEGKILEQHLSNKFSGDRNYATSIYFLLTSNDFSAFHKINQDEIWHFYAGTTLKLHTISPKGVYDTILIGNNFDIGEIPQFVVPAQYYFAAEVLEKNSYAFVGCSVSPGFDFRDFHLPNCNELTKEFPNLYKIIEQLTHH